MSDLYGAVIATRHPVTATFNAPTGGKRKDEMSYTNFADLWESWASEDPDGAALFDGDREITWHEFDQIAQSLSNAFLVAGLERQAKIACLLYNSPEYMCTVFGAFKAAMVPVNINYRYTAREIEQVLRDSDSNAVVFHSSLSDVLEPIRADLPEVVLWVAVDDGGPVPSWAVRMQDLEDVPPTNQPPHARGDDDLILIYTGGTTGMPKGVMWRQSDLVTGLRRTMAPPGTPPGATPPATIAPTARYMPASPLMHGAALFAALNALSQRSAIVTVANRQPRPQDLWDAIARHHVTSLGLVGDAFAIPLVDALEAEPDRWNLDDLATIVSSGVAWGNATKRALIRHLPNVSLIDILGSTEAIGIARSETSASSIGRSGFFRASQVVRLIDEDLRVLPLEPGAYGRVAMSGEIPLGYYKDEAKSAEAFPVLDGIRYSVPGDFGRVEESGNLRLLGRGSGCINSGGEKIFPEEVEEVLKLHPDIVDAACLGIPNERFGEIVCAVVELVPGKELDLDTAAEHVRSHLARFKTPRLLVVLDSLDRSAAGKPNYPLLHRRVIGVATPAS